MDSMPDQSVGGFLSPILSFKKHTANYHTHFNQQNVVANQNDTYYHNTHIHTNSSRNKILSLSGSNSQGMMLNDARFQTNSVWERPIFFYLNQYSTLFYLIIILVFLLCVILAIIGLYIYYRQNRQHSKQKGQQKIPFKQHKHLNNNRQNKIHGKENMYRLDKSIVLSTQRRIEKNNEQNEKNFFEEIDKKKIDAKEIRCSSMLPRTNIIALPEQDKMSTMRSSKDCHPNSTSLNIYDAPLVYSTTQWACDTLRQYMKE